MREDQEDLSDPSEEESYSAGGVRPSEDSEPFSREPSEPLFDAEFQNLPPDSHSSDSVDLLGLNSDPADTPAPAPPNAGGGMKSSSSNSDLLNDLFAPAPGPAPAAPTGSTEDLIGGGVEGDLLFGAPTSGGPPAAAPAPKRKHHPTTSATRAAQWCCG